MAELIRLKNIHYPLRFVMVNSKKASLLWFLLGFGLFMFTRLSRLIPTIPETLLIAPVFILRFSRLQPAKQGIWLTLLGFLLSMNIALWGLFELDSPRMTAFYSVVRSSLLAAIWFFPYMIDRLIYPKFKDKGIWSTLTFPILTTAVFFLSSLEGPFDDGSGTSSTFAYGSLTVMQAQSLFGIWTFVFVYSWLPAIINNCWEYRFRWRTLRKAAIVYPAVLLLLFTFGVFKSSPKASSPETVKIAAAVLIPENGKAVRMEQIFHNRETSPYERTVSRIEGLTQQAAQNGAKIVSFQEFAMLINEEDENGLVDQYKRIAKTNNIYLSITYAYFREEGKGENIHLLINDQGEVLLDYAKRYLFGFGPFGETAVFSKGAEIIQSTETPYGRIGISICRDMAFPSFIRQAARDRVDIMLSPSYDWPKSPCAWYISSPIENGFSFVRPTYNGYSYAADYNGNIIAHMDSDETEDGIMYADVPTKGIKTLYPLIGDSFGWLCVLGSATFAGVSMKIETTKRRHLSTGGRRE